MPIRHDGRRSKCQHIFAPQRTRHDDTAGSVDSVDLEDMLGQIEADGDYSIALDISLFHGRCSFR